jgi:glyceraldehyde-3-phosphate dehydrogenase/erythrose-4-phosphate dehydrogenase
MGVNNKKKYDNSLKILRNASCATNFQGHPWQCKHCKKAHAITATQKTVNGPSGTYHDLLYPRLVNLLI